MPIVRTDEGRVGRDHHNRSQLGQSGIISSQPGELTMNSSPETSSSHDAEWPREGPLPQRPGEVEDRAHGSVEVHPRFSDNQKGAFLPSCTYSDTILIRIKGKARM